jgi:PAS domain S-box-containing protein
MKLRFWPYLAALSATVAVLGGVWVIDRLEQKRFGDRNRTDALNQLSTVRARLEGGLNSRLFLTRGLVARVSTNADIDQAEFDSLARVMVSQQSGIGSIALYKNNIVTHIYPLKGHETAIGFQPMSIPGEREAFERAINSRKTVVAGPVNLIEGGVGFINRTPIFLTKPAEKPESGPYWGMAGIIIDRDILFQEAGLVEEDKSQKHSQALPGNEGKSQDYSTQQPLKYALRGKDGLGSRGEVFFGDATIFQKYPVILEVTLPNGSWQLAAIPQGGWGARSPISGWLRTGGGALAVLSGILVFIWVRSPSQLREAIERATTALRKSETKYRELVDNANSIIVRVDTNGNITFFNEFAQNFFGYSEAEIMGKKLIETIVPVTDNSGHNVAAMMNEVLQDPERYTWHENENIKRNGERVWIAWRNKALLDDNGNLTGILGIGNDVTDRKQAQAKLQESEQKFRSLYESTIDAVMLLDETAFFDCNRATLSMFGCTRKEEFYGKHPSEFSPKFQANGEDSASASAQKIETAFREGSCRFEWLHCRLDKSEFPAEVWLTSVEIGGRKVLQAVVRDISDRIAREEALRSQRQMLRLIMDNIPQAIFWKDRNFVYQGCNHKMALDVGLSNSADIVGLTDYDLPAIKEQADLFREVDRWVMETNTPQYHLSESLRLANGEMAWLDTNKIPLHDAQENVVGLLVTYEDVSDRRRTMEALKESETKFRLLFEQSGDAILLLDENAFIDCNQAALEMIGADSKEQLLNLHPCELSPDVQPDGSLSAEKSKEMNAIALRNGNARFEWVHRRFDGTEFDVEILLTAIPFPGKQILHVVWRDISDRKRAEAGLQASERRLRRTSNALLELANRKTLASGDLNVAIREIVEVATRTLETERASVWLYDDFIFSLLDFGLGMRSGDPAEVADLISNPNKDLNSDPNYKIHELNELSNDPDNNANSQTINTTLVCLDLYEINSDRHSKGATIESVNFPAYFEALRTERIIAAHDAHTDPRTHEFSALYLTPLGITSMLDAPIRVGGQMVGVICHEHIGTPRFWALEEENFAGSLADFVALAIEGAYRMRAQEALQRANQELEIRVEQRTAALKETNRQLLVEIIERQRSEEALRVSEEKFSKAFRSSPDIITITRIDDGRYVEVNETFLRVLGYEREEVINYTASNLNIWANLADRDRIIQMLLNHEIIRNHEFQFRTKTGGILVALLSAERIDLDGEECLLVVATDITERKRAEEEIHLLQTTTQAIVSSSDFHSALEVTLHQVCESIGWNFAEAWIPCKDGTTLECSRGWYASTTSLEKFRVESEKMSFALGRGLPGRTWLSKQAEWINDVSIEPYQVFNRFEIARSNGLKASFSIPVIASDQVLAVLVLYSFEARAEDKRLVELVSAVATQVASVIQRKQAEEALRQAEEKYRTIFENAVEGIFQTTPDGGYISANPALARIYGYSSPEELMANLNNIHQQLYVDRNRRVEFIAAMEEDNAVTGFESEVYRKDGSIIWISENARAVRDLGGEVVYYEGIVEDITHRKMAQEALRYQQQQTESLLLNILPSAIAERLKLQQSTIADSFPEVTVMFADIVGFTQLSAHTSPVALVELLNEIFSTFDQLTEQHGLEKIKTIGDAYMVVGGLPTPRPDHAEAIAEMALDMQMEINRFNQETGLSFQIRVGINTGPVVAGVIGIKKFIYDLWGDTVNTASRMESHGIPGRIQVTAETYQLLRNKYLFEERGFIQVKGKGNMATYLLIGRQRLYL